MANGNKNNALNFFNKGQIEINGKGNYLLQFMNKENNSVSYFENTGNIIMNGEYNRFLNEIGEQKNYFFKNEGNLVMAGERNQFLGGSKPATTIIQLNKPLKIIGKKNIGVHLISGDRKLSAEYKGKLEKSFCEPQLYSYLCFGGKEMWLQHARQLLNLSLPNLERSQTHK